MVSQGCGQLGCFLHRAAQSTLEPRHHQTPASNSLGGLISEDRLQLHSFKLLLKKENSASQR